MDSNATEPARVPQRSLIALVAVVLVIGAVWYYTYTYRSASLPEEGRSLTESSAAYAEGRSQFEAGEYASALSNFEAALADVTNLGEEAGVKFVIAVATSRNGDSVRAVDLFKEIAENENYSRYMRAHAMRALGELSSTRDPVVVDAIFQGSYADMRVKGDLGRSSLNIYTEASALYPLALPELHIAAWHARQLVLAERGDITLTDAQEESYRTLIDEKLASATLNRAAISADSFEGQTLPFIDRLHAIVLGRLVAVGGSVEEAEAAFEAAVASADAVGIEAGTLTRFRQALFLSSIDATEEAFSVLIPLYTDAKYEPTLAELVVGERNDSLEKPELQKLADIDPVFKTFLTAHGWTEADFE